jgi:tetratricopeptide (TPR) repeat protein
MKIKNLVYSIFFSSALIIQGYSQKTSVAAADKKYDRFAYVDAIATYERVANKGYKDSDMFKKIGNAYYFNAELVKAGKWYEQLFEISQDQEP